MRCHDNTISDGRGSYARQASQAAAAPLMGGKGSKKAKIVRGVHQGVVHRTLEGHTAAITCCCFSQDGKYLATCSADTKVILWDTKKMSMHRQLVDHGHRKEVTAVCFSPDSSKLLSCGKDSKLCLWDVKSGARTYSNRLLRGSFTHCAFAPDTKDLWATASEAQCACLWQIQDGRVSKKLLEGHKDIVFQVCFSSDRIHLASCSKDQSIRMWNRSSARIVRKLKDRYSRILTCQFSPDGSLIAAVVDGERVRIWSVTSGEIVNVLEGHHSDPVLCCTFSPYGDTLATGSADQTYALWNVQQLHGLPVFHKKAHTGGVQAIAYSPCGNYIATGSADKKLHIWV